MEERKAIMRIEQNDPLRKREEFAISLRKQKKDKIIQEKRIRLIQNLEGEKSKTVDREGVL